MDMSETSSFSFTQTAKADGQNITQEMLNDTIDELKDWILSALTTVEGNLSGEMSDIETLLSGEMSDIEALLNDSTNAILDRISQSTETICNNVSFLIFGALNATNSTNGTISLISYLDSRLNVSDWNVSVSIDNISLEGVNESSLLGKLDKIYAALGYNNTTATIYADLTSILTGLVDGSGNYILRNSEGESSFYVVGDLLVTSLGNQQLLSDQMTNETNTTINKIQTEASGIKNNVQTNAKWLAENTGSIWSIIAGLGIIFLLLWIFIIKPYLKKRNIDLGMYSDGEAVSEFEHTQTVPGHKAGGVASRMRNPFSLSTVSKNDEPPQCYRDGVSVDLLNQVACGSCPYVEECLRAKMNYENSIEQEKLKAKPEHVSTSMDEINVDLVDGMTKTDINLEDW